MLSCENNFYLQGHHHMMDHIQRYNQETEPEFPFWEGDDERVQEQEQHSPEIEDEYILLRLVDHQFGGSEILSFAYESLKSTIEQQESCKIKTAKATAFNCFTQEVQFQMEERNHSCPICIDICFDHVALFSKCPTCQSAICSACEPFVGDTCPMCRARNPLQLVSRSKMERDALCQLPARMNVRDMVYQIRYCPFRHGRNIFGESCGVNFNMETITHSEFDLELAELLRLTSQKLRQMKNNMSETEFRQTLRRDMDWAVPFERVIPY